MEKRDLTAIGQAFDLHARVGRQAFWAGWAAHLVVSIALAALWLWLDDHSNEAMATVAVGLARAFVLVPQLSMYAGRLKDAAISRGYVFVLIGIYIVAATVAALAARSAVDASQECIAGTYDSCDDEGAYALVALVSGYGPLTGLPGPFSLMFAFGVGMVKGSAANALDQQKPTVRTGNKKAAPSGAAEGCGEIESAAILTRIS